MRNERKRTWLFYGSAVIGMSILTGCYTVKHRNLYFDSDSGDLRHAEPPANARVVGSLDRDALRELLAQARGPDPDERSNAIEAIVQGDPDAATDPAIRAISDQEPQVRFAGCMAVGELRMTEAHDELLKMHDTDPSRVVQVGVRYALHRLGDTRYSHDLEKFAVDPLTEVRGKTAFVLGRLGEPSAILLLRPMRKDAVATIQIQAAESLWRLGDDRGRDDLLAYAISRYADDVILATLALAAPRNPEVIQHVRANLTDDYPEEELAAARALGMLGSDEGYALAMHYLTSDERRQRMMAAMALGAIQHPEARPELAKLLTDPSAQVRLAAATAILELRTSP
jgi:HEAT repeat protein